MGCGQTVSTPLPPTIQRRITAPKIVCSPPFQLIQDHTSPTPVMCTLSSFHYGLGSINETFCPTRAPPAGAFRQVRLGLFSGFFLPPKGPTKCPTSLLRHRLFGSHPPFPPGPFDPQKRLKTFFPPPPKDSLPPPP